jgi:tetratricopeptide (TPR) repeat protein
VRPPPVSTLPAAGGGEVRRRRFALAAILALAASLRLAHWAAVRDEPFFARLAMDSQEYDRWARSIAAGDWVGTEPFFQAPLYPYALAVLYRAVGASLDAVYLVQIAIALAGLVALARAADRMLGPPHGLVAAGLGAVYGPFLFHEVQLLKEGPAVATASCLLALLARARCEAARPAAAGTAPPRPAIAAWLALGAVLGILVLLRENALLLLPFLAPLAWRRGDPRGSARRTAALLAGLALPLAPVAARNAAVGGGFLPTTFQGGANFWIGNNPSADGTYRPISPGKQVPVLERAEPRRIAEAEAGRPLSGAEVSRFWTRRALAWARAEPLDFLALQLRKVGLYLSPYEWPDAVDYAWVKTRSPALALPLAEFAAVALLAAAGLALLARRRSLGRVAPVLAFEAGWLLATVAFFLFSRYRLPAVPGLLILAAVPLAELGRRFRDGRRGSALAGGLAVAAVWALPHAVARPARVDLVEFNLGRLAQEAGDLGAAERHYRRALEAAPRFFLAAMNAGTLAARRGDLGAALPLLELAAALEPASDDAAANLGAARLAAGDLDGARRELARALELNGAHAAARRNLERLERADAPPPGSGVPPP